MSCISASSRSPQSAMPCSLVRSFSSCSLLNGFVNLPTWFKIVICVSCSRNLRWEIRINSLFLPCIQHPDILCNFPKSARYEMNFPSKRWAIREHLSAHILEYNTNTHACMCRVQMQMVNGEAVLDGLRLCFLSRCALTFAHTRTHTHTYNTSPTPAIRLPAQVSRRAINKTDT